MTDPRSSGARRWRAPGRARSIVETARAAGRPALLEPEALELLTLAGIAVPRFMQVPDADAVREADLAALPGERVVIKAVAPGLLHKTEVGGVAIVPGTLAAVTEAIRSMATRLVEPAPIGYLVMEFVDHDRGLGGELLVGVRWTDDFGPVVTVAAGGIEAEALGADLRPGPALAILQPARLSRAEIAEILRAPTAVRVGLGLRSRAPSLDLDQLVDLVLRFGDLGDALMPSLVRECEANPVVATPTGLVALDALVTLGDGDRLPRADRPLDKVDRLLRPRSIAIVGVSERRNPGRIILDNTLAAGFDRDRIWVIKPGTERIAGCRCVPNLAGLPEKVDLLVVAIAASGVPDLLAEVIEGDRAEAVILIPGGLGETHASRPLLARLESSLRAARARPDGGPLINGGNCLGIQSWPGRYDTFFVPPERLGPPAAAIPTTASPGASPAAAPSPLAIVAQSGAFALSRMSRLETIRPRYVITVGNQLDLTIGDHLSVLADDPDIGVLAVYVEGFAPLDGAAFLAAARRFRRRGGTVILYQGGRTRAGMTAAASHTAAMAGDALVTRQLAAQAGVVPADSLEVFDDLLRTFTLLHDRRPTGRRLGAVTNGGFECVAIGDNLGSLELAALDAASVGRVEAALGRAGLSGLIDVHLPLDLTPMADDAAYDDVVAQVLASPSVDVGLVGIVPFSASIMAIDPDAAGSIASRLGRRFAESTKPWVVVVDAGALYDPFATRLAAAGIPVFRTADAAVRALATYCDAFAGRAETR